MSDARTIPRRRIRIWILCALIAMIVACCWFAARLWIESSGKTSALSAEEITLRWIKDRREARAWIKAHDGIYTGYTTGTVPHDDKPRAQENWLGLAPSSLRRFRESGVSDIRLRDTSILSNDFLRAAELAELFPEAKIKIMPPPHSWTLAERKARQDAWLERLTKIANNDSLSLEERDGARQLLDRTREGLEFP